MSSPSSVFSNTVFQVVGKVLTLIFGLATTAIVYRTLGTNEYGVYVFVTSFVLLFASVSDWGTEIITLREASRFPNDQGRIFGTAFIVRLLLSVVAIVLGNIAIRLLPSWEIFVFPVTLFSLAIIGVSFKTTSASVFLSQRAAFWSAASEVVNNGLYFLAVLAILPRLPSLITTLTLLVLSAYIAGGVAWYWANRLVKISVKFHPELGRALLKEALPTGALLTTFYVYNRVDIVILQHFQGNDTVGFYGLAYKIHDNLVQGAAFLMNAVFPLIAANLPKEKFRLLYQRAFHVLFGSGLVLTTTFFLAAPFVISLLSGSLSLPSIVALRILIFATFVAYLNHLTGYTLIALGHQRASLAFALIALSFNVIGNLLFIPTYSFIAASFMTVATEGLVFLLSSYAIFHYTGAKTSLTNFFSTISLAIKTRGHLFESTSNL